MTEIFNRPNGHGTQWGAMSLTAPRLNTTEDTKTSDVSLELKKIFQEARQQMGIEVPNISTQKDTNERCEQLARRYLVSSHAPSGEVNPWSSSPACHPSASTAGDTEDRCTLQADCLTKIRSYINQMRSIKPIARLGTILLLASIFGVFGVLLWPHISAYGLTAAVPFYLGYAVTSVLLLYAVDSLVKRPSAQKRSQMLKIIQDCLKDLQAPFQIIPGNQGLCLSGIDRLEAKCRHNELLQELVRIPGLVECDLQNTDLRTIPDLSEACDLKILNIEGNSHLDFEHNNDNLKNLLSARHSIDLFVNGK